jgi:predicted enzyme related to lactoylglutathione lyase
MSLRTSYTPGTFSWVDLATSDPDGAKTFYTQFFGWTFKDMPAGDTVYTLFFKDEKKVSAMFQLSKDKPGIPPHWKNYVSVENVDETALRIQELGGSILEPAFDVLTSGRLCIAQDPTGAMFALWEAKESFGAERVNDPGSLCWNELYTQDTVKAESFYTQLFGWSVKKAPDAPGPVYHQFYNKEMGAGGMLEIQPEWDPVPPHWIPYFAVENCDESLEQAKKLGAKINNPAMDIPNVGRMGSLQDPQGGHFNIIALVEGIAD